VSKPNHTNRPYMFRWLYTVQDDTGLSHRAKTAAVPIFRHAHLDTGKGCYVGAETAARETGASRSTIQRGWAELAEAGYLNIWQPNRGSGKGADRWARFPTNVSVTERRCERPGDALEAERSAEETSPPQGGSVSRATRPQTEERGSGSDETTRPAPAHSGADGATLADADQRPCLDCAQPTGWRFDDVCRKCRDETDRKAATAAPPIGHRDDWELRNA
jgi:hypothetical protein